jgi:hypothetical protein
VSIWTAYLDWFMPWRRPLSEQIRNDIKRDAERNLNEIRFEPRIFTNIPPPERGVIES